MIQNVSILQGPSLMFLSDPVVHVLNEHMTDNLTLEDLIELMTDRNDQVEPTELITEGLIGFQSTDFMIKANCCDVDDNATSNFTQMGPELPTYMFVYVTLFNVLIFVVGVLGNVMVIYVVARMKAMRTQMNYFLMTLSVADLLVLVICQSSGLLEFYAKDRWLLGEGMCRLVPFLENATLHSSVLTLLTIGFERYYTICHALKDQNTCLLTSTGVFVTCIWIFSYLLSLPFIFLTTLEDAYHYETRSLIKVCRTKVDELLPKLYIVAIFCIFLILPMIMLTYMYSSIIQKLFRLNSESSPQNYTHAKTIRSRKQVVRMLVAIVILFFVSFLPIRIFGLWMVFTPSRDQERLGFVTYNNILSTTRILCYVNSAGNPIIYALVSTKFRSAFRRSLVKCLPGGQTPDSYTPRTTPRLAN